MHIYSTAYDHKQAFKAFLLFCLFMLLGSIAHAQYATGGSSPYRDQVLWLTWGGGENGTPNQPLNVGSLSSASIQVAGGSQLNIQCSIDAVSHSGGGTPQLQSYRPGDWQGDILDDLYNIGGTGGNNQLINGISRSGGVADFTIGCTATLGGQAYNLKGLVMADAEAINTGTEYVEATAEGTWNVVEMAQNPGAGVYNAVKTNNGSLQTIRFGPGTDDETAAVTFLSFTNPSNSISMDFSIEGGGTTAIAIGLLVPYADFGDAPASYGDAMHLVNDLQFQDDNLPADGNQYDLNDSGYQPGGLAPSMDNFVGSQGPDTELEQDYDTNAATDDNGNSEEDAWPDNYTITVLQEGETLSETIPCTGSGSVAGWIDFDRNGTFDSPTERAESLCSGGTANLSWTISSDLTAGTSYVRLRFSTNSTEITGPAGTASDGEAEDHVMEITAPELSVTKSSNATGGTWDVGEQNARYDLTVTNNGPVGTGDLPDTPVEPVTVRDQLPTGIEPDWTGTYTTNGWSCTYAGQEVTCETSEVIEAAGQAGDTSVIELPVQVTEDAIGQQTNYASIAGGRDPFNDGNTPAPGPSCTDAEHCDDYMVTVEQNAALDLVKSTDPVTYGASGETIEYSFAVMNTGNVTMENIEVEDPMLGGTVPCSLTTLAPGESTDCGPVEYTVTQQDVDNGEITNTATASGEDPGGTVIGETDEATVTADQTPELTVEKGLTNVPSPIVEGSELEYTITATNSGNVTLANVAITDPMLTPDTESCGTLNVGDGCTLTGTYTVTSSDVDAEEVVNTATATGDDPAGDPVEEEDQVTEPIPVADLAVSKSVDNATPNVGEDVIFTVSVTNNGTAEATNVSITDQLPSGFSFVSATASQGNYSDGTGIWTIGTVANGAAVTLDITATVEPSGPYENTASVSNSDQEDPDPNNDEDTSEPNPSASADVEVIKTLDTNGPFKVDQQIQYTLEISNYGPSQATNIVVEDTPTNLTMDNVSGSGCSSFPCTIPSLASGGSTTINITATIDAAGAFDNEATANADEYDPNEDNNTDGSGNGGTADPEADLSLTKTVNNANPDVGQDVIFTITATNAGPSEATGVSVIDQLPSGYSFVSATPSMGSYDSGSGTWTIGTLADGTNATLDITATVLADGDYENTASVTGDEDDPNPGNETGTSTPNPVPQADITLTKNLDTSGPYVAGQSVDYQIAITNNGPSDATNIEVTDTPTNLTIDNVSGSGCTSFPCTIPNLANSSTTTISVTGTVQEEGAFGNTATATPSEEDPNPDDNRDNDGDSGDASADVAITKVLDTAGPYNAGQEVAYTITLSNNGPSDATGILVEENPTNLTITGVSGSGCSSFPCTVPNLAEGSQTTISVTATVDAEGDFDNEVTATPTENDPNEDNNTSTDGGSADPSADVSIDKTLDTAGPYSAGQEVQYTVTVANAGPSDAQNVEITETPTNLTITEVSGGGCSSFPCIIPTVTSGDQQVLSVTATIDAEGPFQNGVTVTSDTDDPDPSDNDDDDPENGGEAGTSSDISITKTLDTEGPYAAGQEVNYTLKITNAGPSEATNIDVTDTPENLTITDVSGACTELPCTIPSLAADGSTTITVTTTIDEAGDFQNTATVTSDTPDPDPNNNEDPGTGGNADPSADVSIDKTLDTEGSYVAGQEISYTLTVANTGPSEATGIEVTDTPTNLSIANVSGSGCSSFPCTIPSLASGDETTIDVTATIEQEGSFDNVATATPNEDDPTPDNNTDDDGNGGSADPSADVALTKTLVTDGPYNAGETVTFEILISNAGPSEATSINVTDTPTNIIIDNVSGACTTLPCTIPSLASGDETTMTVQATIDEAGSFRNTATATPSENDPNPGNNTGSDGDSGDLLADLSLTKTLDTPGPYVDGEEVQYTITVSNAGPSEATGALVIDTPTNLTVNNVSGACSSLPCDLSSIPASDQREITLLATIDTPGSFDNTATINAAQDDPTPENNTDNDGSSGSALVDVSVDKTLDTPGSYVDGQQVRYTLDISNDGPSEATNIEVTDTPTNLSIDNVSGACTTLPCTIASLASGAKTSVTVMATIDSPGAFDNTVTVTPAEEDSEPSNNTDDTENGGSADASADLSMSKSVDNATPDVGKQVTFTLSISNAGPSEATGVTVTDQLPSGYDFVGAQATAGSYDESSGIWTVGSLADGANASLDLTATVLDDGDYANTTTVDSDTPDPDPNDNTGGSTPNPNPSADVAVTKTLNTGGPYAAGQQVDYTIAINNNGPSEATGIEVTDTPTNLTITNVSGSGCSSFPCTIPSLASGNETSITVTATINSAGSFGNTATATPNEDDPNPENNTGRDGDSGQQSADVALTKTLVTPAPYVDGQQIEYTLTISNSGPSEATGVLVEDTPTNLSIDNVSGACTTLPCTIASIPDGEERQVTVMATIEESGAFDNKATATPTEDDPDPSDNTDGDPENGGSANASADLSVNKTLITTGPYSAGQQIEYELVVSNDGPSAVKEIEITESPTNLTITNVSGAGCSNFPCTITSLAADGQTTVTITATIDEEGAFNNSVTVTSSVDDPNPSDNTDDDPENGGSANASVDVSLDKILSTSGPYKVDQKVRYTLFIANDGPSEATDIVITDTPENLTIVGVSGTDCSSFPCTIPSLSAGGQTSINVTATIDASGDFNNTATATPSENDGDNSDNTDSDGGTANTLADVSIAKSLQTAGPYKAGQEVSYRLVVDNEGPSVARDVEITDTPQNLTITGVVGACSELPCTISSLAVGAQTTIDVTATIDGGGQFDNIATAESESIEDPELTNNTDDDQNNSGTAQKLTDVSVKKTLETEGPYVAGQQLEYVITVTNNGPSEATGVVVEDTPTNLRIDEASGAGCSSFPCTIPSLPAEDQANITVLATIQAAGSFDNTASANGAEEDTDLENNNDAVSATAQAPELRITKQAQNLTARAGGFVPYTVTIDNLSEVPVKGVQLVDTPPPGLSYVEQSLGVTDMDNAGLVEGLRPLRIGQIDVPAGGQATVSYVMRVGATALPGALRNVAYAARNGSPVSGEDEASVMLEGDPMMDETRVLGTVFRDHDRDGWQDKATATDLHAQGGFTPDAYVPGSTAIDRGTGPEAVPDGSAPLLKGLELGDLGGRESVGAEPAEIVIRQRLRTPDLTGDFSLTSDEGTQLRMDGSGVISRDPKGALKRGANSQRLEVERTLNELDNGEYELIYRISNAGYSDWGLPGARLATPRGLMIETDGYGRYHIEAIQVDSWRRGRNYVVKVDGSSLPRSSTYTTENPLVRRVTQGLPVRFDFGIWWPSADVSITKTLVADSSYHPGQQVTYRLTVANDGPTVAEGIRLSDRSDNLKMTDVRGAGCDTLPCVLPGPLAPGQQRQLMVKVRIDTAGAFTNTATAWAEQPDPAPDNNKDRVRAVATADTVTPPAPVPPPPCAGAEVLPKAVHFETDQATIISTSAQLLDQLAVFLADRPECTLQIAGHTDHDLGHDYNQDLSERRAEAIAAYLKEAGVPAERITYTGASYDNPAVEEKDVLDKAQNRRTSFTLQPGDSAAMLLPQIEDLQVDPEPRAWDYVFDFRHNAVPTRLHFPAGSAELNFVSEYIVQRISLALAEYSDVTVRFGIPASSDAGLNERRKETLQQTLAESGLSTDRYRIAASGASSGPVRISYTPDDNLILVGQADDVRLAGDERYRPLLQKALRLLEGRRDSPLLGNPPTGVLRTAGSASGQAD
ncbi:CshA/CshB family fibrillar adhesin-related protein [Fodinibius salsisoli]|uniref:DUF11 domain-containing protein n=1 Tax=Fodinibius salsisoli TaxID=2820877 RepID=A0ABT3PHN6_9BACT|nr:CshA/CshB family fibrillar adhesin-related protein [Fodinibius salsisoli]MCW9705422.1 DUF11 domain-containing protein [Fodinibius salsisoli]